jgi:hypothetical protein
MVTVLLAALGSLPLELPAAKVNVSGTAPAVCRVTLIGMDWPPAPVAVGVMRCVYAATNESGRYEVTVHRLPVEIRLATHRVRLSLDLQRRNSNAFRTAAGSASNVTDTAGAPLDAAGADVNRQKMAAIFCVT